MIIMFSKGIPIEYIIIHIPNTLPHNPNLYDRDLDEYKFSNNVLMTKCIRSLGHYCFHSSWMFLRCTS